MRGVVQRAEVAGAESFEGGFLRLCTARDATLNEFQLRPIEEDSRVAKAGVGCIGRGGERLQGTKGCEEDY